jgi:AcrR family transcriptional regulator
MESRSQEETREDIETAFWKLYREKPAESISIRELMDLAGYNRSTFYRYYVDIYDLLDKVENRLVREADRCFNECFGESLERYRCLGGRENYEKMMRIFYIPHMEEYELLLTTRDDRKFHRKAVAMVGYHLRRLLEINGVDMKDPYARYIASYFGECHIAAVNSWYREGKQVDSDCIVDMMYNLQKTLLAFYLPTLKKVDEGA